MLPEKRKTFVGKRILWTNRKQDTSDPGRETDDRIFCSFADKEHLFVEKLQPECRLGICGGGHIAKSMVRIGVLLDYHITVIDDRPLYAYEAEDRHRLSPSCRVSGRPAPPHSVMQSKRKTGTASARHAE